MRKVGLSCCCRNHRPCMHKIKWKKLWFLLKHTDCRAFIIWDVALFSKRTIWIFALVSLHSSSARFLSGSKMFLAPPDSASLMISEPKWSYYIKNKGTKVNTMKGSVEFEHEQRTNPLTHCVGQNLLRFKARGSLHFPSKINLRMSVKSKLRKLKLWMFSKMIPC